MRQSEEEHRRLALLRQRAEEALRGKPVELDGLSPEDIQYLLHELQVHQTELSLQNDELRQVQEELEASRDLYSDLYNFAPAGYCTLNRQNTILEANQTLGVMLGIEPKALIRQKLAKFVDRDDQNKYFMHCQHALAGQGRQVSEIRMQTRNGELMQVRMESIVAPRNANHLRVMLSDISNQKRAEVALQASEARLKLATEAANIGIWDWDLISGEHTWNERCNLLLGLPAENALSLSVFLNSVHPEDRDRMALLKQITPAEQELIESEYRVIWPDSSVHWLMDIGKTYFDPSGTPLRTTGISMDITRQKLFEEKLKENAELGEINRQLQEFAFTASHDLQAPLRRIKGFVRLLSDHYANLLNEEAQDYVDRMYKSAVRMDKMLKDVLSYSQVDNHDSEEFVPVNLDQVIQDVLEELEDQIQQTGGRVEVSHLPTILADPLQMFQLFQNLIDNGLKFARSGVPPLIKIYAQNLEIDENTSEGSAQPQVKIYVEDNGIGFEMKLLDQLFQPFHRLVGRSQFEGTGLGLAICHKIVEHHGGSITAESKLQQGTIFIVTLPLRE